MPGSRVMIVVIAAALTATIPASCGSTGEAPTARVKGIVQDAPTPSAPGSTTSAISPSIDGTPAPLAELPPEAQAEAARVLTGAVPELAVPCVTVTVLGADLASRSLVAVAERSAACGAGADTLYRAVAVEEGRLMRTATVCAYCVAGDDTWDDAGYDLITEAYRGRHGVTIENLPALLAGN